MKLLDVGAGFDWITPLVSLVMGAVTEHEHAAVDVVWMPHVRAAASELAIKLHNEMVIDDRYYFDCTPREWKRICQYLGWRP